MTLSKTWTVQWDLAAAFLNRAESCDPGDERGEFLGRFLLCVDDFLRVLEYRYVDHEDREDVGSAAKVDLFKQLSHRPKLTIEDDSKLMSYLYTTYKRLLVRHAVKHSRTRAKERSTSTSPPDEDGNGGFDPVSSIVTPLEQAETEELRQRLHEAIKELPAVERTIIELKMFGGHSDLEIADRLQMTRPTVQRLRTAALDELKRLIDASWE